MDSVGDGNLGRLSNRCDVVTAALLDEHLHGTAEPKPGYASESSAEFQDCLIQKEKYKQCNNSLYIIKSCCCFATAALEF